MPRLTYGIEGDRLGLSSLGGIIRQDVNEIFTNLEVGMKPKQSVSLIFSNNRNEGNISKHYVLCILQVYILVYIQASCN